MKKFEYTIQYEVLMQEDLNIMGSRGWELVSVVGTTSYRWYYWKREIESGKEEGK